jgi:4-amino-4-deoxy-L-arabinose transferase-like glycosyltransferase
MIPAWLREHRAEALLVAVVLMISGVAHGWNMFGFPYYENDEGTYMSQAWSVLEFGTLAPYTYWYDHAPAGWLLIALFTKLTGGFFTWGVSINSGRVLMLVLHILSSLLLYLFAKRLTGSKLAGTTAVLIFALTPLGLQYQRRVLLDNIMVFWILTTFCLIAYYRGRLRNIVLSALCMGVAILSKEPAIFFLPPVCYYLYVQTNPKHRKMAVVVWGAVTLLIVSTYPLYALLKQEFFPAGTLFGGDYPHVSLLETLTWQAGRVGDVGALSFLRDQWMGVDPFLILIGGAATLINLMIGVRLVSARVVGFTTLAFCVYLFRGGSLIVFYVLPLVPFLALNIAYLLWQTARAVRSLLLPRLRFLTYGVAILPFAVIATTIAVTMPEATKVYVNDLRQLYTSRHTEAQVQAITWLLSATAPAETVLIDNYAYVDLNARTGSQNFEYYWKADTDPEIKMALLKEDHNNVDMMLVTPQLQYDVSVSPEGFPLVKAVMDNSVLVESFERDGYKVSIMRNPGARSGKLSAAP